MPSDSKRALVPATPVLARKLRRLIFMFSPPRIVDADAVPAPPCLLRPYLKNHIARSLPLARFFGEVGKSSTWVVARETGGAGRYRSGTGKRLDVTFR
jgi:hypothetical protein